MNPTATLHRLLAAAVQREASDLHIAVKRRPIIRVAGELLQLEDEEALNEEGAQAIISELMHPDQRERFIREHQLDFAYALSDNTRFRVNAYIQQNSWSAALRLVPAKIRTIDELGLPAVIHEFAKMHQGFVLLVGPAGHGKSTTTAAILDEINRERSAHIITIEDPIEYIFNQGRGIVSQREVGSDTASFADGLKTVLRQDPDVVMVGEMRDSESIAAAMTAAETGHLVFSTLHTNSASQTIDRIIDSFPPAQQQQVITQIATTLVAIISVRLIPSLQGGRVLASEVMIMNPAIRNLIRERKVYSIDSVIQMSADEHMITLNHSLAKLILDKRISLEHGEIYSPNPVELRKLL